MDLSEVIERVLSLVRGRAQKQNVALNLLPQDAPVLAEVDQDPLQQLVLNLVLSALGSMPAGGTIEVEICPPRDSFVEFYVHNTGPGISTEVLPEIFETFVSSKETGLGLGLPVSKRIAEDHGGSLSTYNLPGAGRASCCGFRRPHPPEAASGPARHRSNLPATLKYTANATASAAASAIGPAATCGLR